MRYSRLAAALVAAGLLAAAAGEGRAEGSPPLPLGHRDFVPSPDHPVGFRGDWTGKYPGATPPLRWSETENVAWKVPVGAGESSPVVVGSKIFILTDGLRLQCLRAADGATLWQRDHHLRPDGPAEKALLGLEEYVRRYHRLRSFQDALCTAERALVEERRAAERARTAPDAGRTAALEKEIAALKDRAAALEAEVRAAAADLAPENVSGQFSRAAADPTRPNALTYAIATICSDGRRVYAWLPIGVLAAYDLDGRREWLRVLGSKRASGGWYGGQVAPSPVLADGRLVIHYDKIYCLDAADGRTLWEQPQRVLCIPSPVAGARGGAWYVALGTMQVLRLADGAYVHGDSKGGFHDLNGVGSPIFFGGAFTWTSHAVQLPDRPDGAPALLWELDGDTRGRLTRSGYVPGTDEPPAPARGMGWHHYGSPVEHDGLIYYHHEHGMLSAVGSRTGKWVFTRPLEGKGRGGRCGGAVYPGLTMAGGYLFATGGGGDTLVLEPKAGKDVAIVAENRLAPFGGNRLVFAGNRAYIHVGERLWCLGGAAP